MVLFMKIIWLAAKASTNTPDKTMNKLLTTITLLCFSVGAT